MRRSHVALLMVCTGLAGCGVDSEREVTGPAGGMTDGAGSKSGYIYRATGERVPVRVARPAPSVGWRDPGVRPAAAAAVCDAGFIDADGSPEGGLDGGTYTSVEVPAGAICVLSGVEVTNSVRALAGSRLFIHSSEIGGNVRGIGASAVQMHGSQVGGNFNIQGGHDLHFASCSVDDVTIAGDLVCAENDPGSPIIRTEQGPVEVGGSIRLVDNVIPGGHVMLLLNAQVAADADVRRNGGPGHKQVEGNVVTGELACKKNDATFIGGPNTAGSFKGQCF